MITIKEYQFTNKTLQPIEMPKGANVINVVSKPKANGLLSHYNIVAFIDTENELVERKFMIVRPGWDIEKHFARNYPDEFSPDETFIRIDWNIKFIGSFFEAGWGSRFYVFEKL